MTLEFDVPQVDPISAISPTTAWRIEQCMLREAFYRDEHFSKLRARTTAAALGIAAHSTMERILLGLPAGTQMPEDARQVVEQVWSEATQVQAKTLASEWSPSVPPPREEWPNYQLTRTRLIRRLSGQVWIRDSKNQGESSKAVEQWLEDLDARIRGKPDLVVTNHGTSRIIDFKSGAHQSAPTAQQRFQLLVYAHLFRSRHGTLPKQLLVRNLLGEEFEVDFLDADVVGAYESCVQALQRYNEAAESGQLAGTPSVENCSSCNFRVCCPNFSSAELGEWTGTNTLIGIVDKVHQVGEGVVVDVKLRFPDSRVGMTSRILGVAQLQQIGPGDLIGVSGFATQSDWAMIRTVWNSLVWVKRVGAQNA